MTCVMLVVYLICILRFQHYFKSVIFIPELSGQYIAIIVSEFHEQNYDFASIAGIAGL